MRWPPRARVRVRGPCRASAFGPTSTAWRARGLGGFVLNDSHGVLLEVEGPVRAVEQFLAGCREAPPLALIERVGRSRAPPARRRRS